MSFRRSFGRTPPNAGRAARTAAEVADIMLSPCRLSAFDLSAIQTTAKLVQLLRKPAFVFFTAAAPRVYAEASELVAGFGTLAAPLILPNRAAYRHAAADGRTVTELDPGRRGTAEVRALYK